MSKTRIGVKMGLGAVASGPILRFALVLLSCWAAFSAWAERELTIGEYTAEAQRRVRTEIGRMFADAKAAVEGTVTFVGEECYFLQSDNDGIKVVDVETMPKVGEVVEATGTPSLEGGRVVFVEKSRKVLGTDKLPKAVPVSGVMLASARPGVNAIRASIEGRVIGAIEGGFALEVDGAPINVKCEKVPAFLHNAEVTHPKVSVRGVVETVLDQSVLFGDSNAVLGVRVYVASADEVELLPDALYYARCGDVKVRIAIGVVIVALVLVLVALAGMMFRQRQRLFRSRTIMAERKRMAGDIHDTIEQHLVGAKMLISLGRNKEAMDVMVRAKRELRDIIWGLQNDDMMRQTPAAMLRELAKSENAKGLCRVDVKLDKGLPPTLEAAKMRDLSLIVREAIGNAVKHGGARQIALAADPRPDGGWMLRISNNGAQFDAEKVPGAAEGHFGLVGMRERARRLDGEISFARRKEGMMVVLEVKK